MLSITLPSLCLCACAALACRACIHQPPRPPLEPAFKPFRKLCLANLAFKRLHQPNISLTLACKSLPIRHLRTPTHPPGPMAPSGDPSPTAAAGIRQVYTGGLLGGGFRRHQSRQKYMTCERCGRRQEMLTLKFSIERLINGDGNCDIWVCRKCATLEADDGGIRYSKYNMHELMDKKGKHRVYLQKALYWIEKRMEAELCIRK